MKANLSLTSIAVLSLFFFVCPSLAEEHNDPELGIAVDLDMAIITEVTEDTLVEEVATMFQFGTLPTTQSRKCQTKNGCGTFDVDFEAPPVSNCKGNGTAQVTYCIGGKLDQCTDTDTGCGCKYIGTC